MDRKYYFFDFDGTLVDSMPYLEKLTLGFLNKYNLKYPDNIMDIIIPLGYRGGAEYYVSTYKELHRTVEQVKKELEEGLFVDYRDTIPLKSGALEYLLKIKREGKKLFILSASQHLQLDVCINRLRIGDLFDRVISCEEYGTTKGDTQLYKKVAKDLGITPKDIVFVDDNINSIKTAKKAGCYCVGVYDKVGDKVWEEMQEVADETIKDFGNKL